MGKNKNSQTRKYAGKSFKKMKPNPKEGLHSTGSLSSSSQYKSDRNLKSLTRSSSNLLLKSSLRKSKSEDSVHKNKLVTNLYKNEQQTTASIDNLAALVKGLEIQEEQNQKALTSTSHSELSINTELESSSPLSESSTSPRLQRKGSFDLNLQKSPLFSYSSDEEEGFESPVVPEFSLNSNLGYDIDYSGRSSTSLSPRGSDELSDNDKEIVIHTILSLVFFRDCIYSFTGARPLPFHLKTEISSVLYSVLFYEEHTLEDLDLEGNEFLECFITEKVLNRLLYDLRYESPYGMSARFLFLENVSHINKSIYFLLLKLLYIYSQDYLELERTTPYIDSEETPSPANLQITGHIHRYISLYDSLVKFFREFTSLDESFIDQDHYYYFSQCIFLHISLLMTFLKTRFAVSKYTNLLASLSNILISINNSIIPRLFHSILKVWPKGYETAFLEYLEQLLASLPPLYTIQEYKPSLIALFRAICHCLSQSQAKIAARAVSLFTNYYICNNLIYVDEDICNLVKNALLQGTYWNPIVAEDCEDAFDSLLDSL